MPLLPEIHLPRLTGQMLVDVVHREGVTAGIEAWHPGEIAGKILVTPLFSPLFVFLFSRISGFSVVWSGSLASLD